MKTKQLTEILNVDVRREARQYFKRDVDIDHIKVNARPNGGHNVVVEFVGGGTLSFDYDCHGHRQTGTGADLQAT